MQTNLVRLRVLIVEDNDGDARLLRESLRDSPTLFVDMDRATTLQAAIQQIQRQPPDAVLLDLQLPDSQGLDTLRSMCAQAPRTPVIVLTGISDETMAVAALREGAQDYLTKTEVDARMLLRAIRYAMERKENESALHEMQDQLLQAQRMDAVGRLAGGIAHDFNNLLTIIQGYARMLQDSVPADTPTYRDVAAISAAADRAARLTHQLLAYGRKQVMQLRVVSVGEILLGMESLLRRTMRENIQLTFAVAPDLGPTEADPAQIEQVILNLAMNAQDAMPTGGKMILECSNVQFDAAWVKRHPDVRPGEYVQLAVTDTGIGMEESVAQHIFDPFYTTKPFGAGTGLGLSTVYGVIKQHRGHIWVYSERGHGSTLKVVLPRAQQSVTTAAPPFVPLSAVRGTETLLLVEDEKEILQMLRACLEGLGYTVHTAANARDAFKLVQQHAQQIALLVADVVLPDLSGPELYEGIRVVHPDLKVLFMSAYPGDAVKQRGLLEPSAPFIGKPFTPEVLARRIREVLDNTAPPHPA